MLLELSKRLGMRELRGQMIEAAYSHEEFPHNNNVKALVLAATYSVRQWFIPAFEDILTRPLKELSQSDLFSLNGHPRQLLRHLIRERKDIEATNALVIVRRDRFLRSGDCVTEALYCKKRWMRFWRDIALPVIMNEGGGVLSDRLAKTFQKGGRGTGGTCSQCWKFNWWRILRAPAESMNIRYMAKHRAHAAWDVIKVEERDAVPRDVFG